MVLITEAFYIRSALTYAVGGAVVGLLLLANIVNLAADLGVAAGSINIKATTTERLGFIGRGEGLAAMAVVLLDAQARSST